MAAAQPSYCFGAINHVGDNSLDVNSLDVMAAVGGAAGMLGPPFANLHNSGGSFMDFHGRRSPALGTRGMVATSQPLATEAGLRILQKGGTAADAAVAVAAALNVMEPTSTGIGGDAFCLYYDAKKKKVSCVQGGGRSPAKLTLELCRERGHGGTEIVPSTDALCVMVPGAPQVWEDVVARHGKLSLADVLQVRARSPKTLKKKGFAAEMIMNLKSD